MKKIIKIMFFTLAFFMIKSNCYAKEVIVGDEIPNAKIHLKFDDIDENRTIYELIDKDTNESLYNISPKDTNYNIHFDTYNFYSGLNYLLFEIKEDISQLAYFGYGYRNRTDKKWYLITQYLIWEKIVESEGGEIYFVDESNNPISIFDEEINEIKQDLIDHAIIPSFSYHDNNTYNITLSNKFVLEDTNNVLNTFDIECLNEDAYELKDNTIIIDPTVSYAVNFKFRKKLDINTNGLVYNASNKSILMHRGLISRTTSFAYVNVRLPRLVLESTPLNNFALENQEFTLYNENNVVWSTIKFNEEGISDVIDICPGKYYLINTNTPYGYKKVEPIEIEIVKDDVNYKIPNELITKHVTLEYRIASGDKYEVASNKDIEIYNNNELVKQVKTNEDGLVYLDFNYGTYEIKAKDLEDSLEVIIDENYEEFKPLILVEKEVIEDPDIKEDDPNKEDKPNTPEDVDDSNKEDKPNTPEDVDDPNKDDKPDTPEDETNKGDLEISKGTIIINKIDSQTGLGLANIRYGLFDKNKTLIASDITDTNGKLIFKDIEAGTYYLKEILNDEDYSLGDDYYEVEVKSDINTILTNTNHTAIKVPNTYQEYNHNYLLIIFLVSLYGLKKKF